MDRTQAARLYAGNVEHGYFLQEMQQRCKDLGMSAAEINADQLVDMTALLPDEELRSGSFCA